MSASKVRGTAEGGGEEECQGLTLPAEEYQELTEKEREELEKVLKEEERRSGEQSLGVQDIAAFTDHLSQQLNHHSG